MKHNPIRETLTALETIRQETNEGDIAYAIANVWASIDDLTHDGYSVVDYDSDIMEAINEWGDVLQPDTVADLRALIQDRESLKAWGKVDNVQESMDYLHNLAYAVDRAYEKHGPFYCRFGDGDPLLECHRLDDESEFTEAV